MPQRDHFDLMPLSRLVESLIREDQVLEQSGPVDRLTINHLAADSRQVGPHGVFAAIRGTHTDGHLFLEKAVQNGATAIVYEAMSGAPTGAPDIARIRVRDARVALSALAAEAFGHPSAKLWMCGVTGTNGKSTTAWIVERALHHLGVPAGLIGTIAYRIGGEDLDAPLTTPDAVTLHSLLRTLVRAGGRACAMETSSHALDQHRVDHLRFDVAVFTNLSRDHLDYHGSFEEYLKAKKRLFDQLPATALSLYNAEDPAGPRLVADTRSKILSYGRTPSADVQVEILDNRVDGLQLKIDGQRFKTRLAGEFNALNIAAAYASVREMGFASSRIAEALETVGPVPGRFALWRAPTGVAIVVDYSHTPDALDHALKAARDVLAGTGSLWCVFGAGGDRDRGKRPIMGAVAEKWADYLVVTSDNPRTEEPLAIIQDILEGLSAPERAIVLPDRRAAIRHACSLAAPNDLVLIAGKGHETYQIIGTTKRHFNDLEEARKTFESPSPDDTLTS